MIGRYVLANGFVTVTSLGTAGGAFSVPLPFTASSVASAGSGWINSTAAGLSVVIGANALNADLRKYDATTPGGSCAFSYGYEASS